MRGSTQYTNMGNVQCSMKYIANVAEFNCAGMLRMVGIKRVHS